MIEASYNELSELFSNATHLEGDVQFQGVVTDTRKECQGSLYIALEGEYFDGHDYVQAAYEKGAVIALVSKPIDSEIPQVLVNDTLKAYGLLANFWRRKVNPIVIAITGSNGKTTVKEMLANILSIESNVLATEANFNNEVGVPQTLCGLTKKHQFAVIEMGANHAGEIERLVKIAEPNLVYVNNAAGAHLEGFGSLQGVQQAKGEMYRYAHANSTAVFNSDDEASVEWLASANSQHKITISSQGNAADYESSFSENKLKIKTLSDRFAIALKVKGEHNHTNALAAATMALALNVARQNVISGLSAFVGFKGRLQFVEGFNGSTLIDDTYNANTASFKAGIKVLCALDGEAWLAMGDMGELGEQSQQEHDEVVRFAKNAGVKALFTKGLQSRKAARLMSHQAQSFDDFQPMIECIQGRLKSDINLLIKGSRSAQMERLVSALQRGIS